MSSGTVFSLCLLATVAIAYLYIHNYADLYNKEFTNNPHPPKSRLKLVWGPLFLHNVNVNMSIIFFFQYMFFFLQMHEDLLRMQVAVSKQQVQVEQMNDDAENCRRLVEGSRAALPHSSLPRQGKHIDLERLDKEVTQLNNRWNSVCSQLAERYDLEYLGVICNAGGRVIARRNC